jgi:uncharacterized protein YcbX
LVRAALRRMRGKVYAAGFASRVSFRRVAASETPGFVFTFAQRFLDGRGEAIEERFEPVFVALNSSASTDAEHDRRRFAAESHGNLPAEERHLLMSRFKADFERARDAAMLEAQRRQTERVKVLSEQQDRIAEEALIRLGRWEQASEQRLQQRLSAVGAQQMDLFGVVARRLRQFQKEQEQLLKQKETRRAEIRAMKQVRADALDAIGALVVYPEGFK